jgi:soluble lytic murein transglycosylase-like protein
MTCSTFQHPPPLPIESISIEAKITKFVALNKNYEPVLTFYDSLTNSRRITKAIISNVIKYNVPINFAMAMAKKESNFYSKCKNYNDWNDSWDRGIFQLNDKSFNLSEDDFFNPEINARYGLQYYAEQLNDFHNCYTAMIAYNWGPNRVRAGKTPPIKVVCYTKDIEKYENEFNNLFISQFKI